MLARPRATLLFYGIPRRTDICLPSIKKHVLLPLQVKFDVTVKGHLWEIDAIANPRSGENGQVSTQSYDAYRDLGVRIEKQTVEDTEVLNKWKSFGDIFNNDFASLNNLYFQLTSLRRAFNLAVQNDPDVVVFVRPDLLYHGDIPKGVFEAAAGDQHLCVAPSWNWWGGLNDRYAICGRQAARAYGSRLEKALEYAQTKHQPIHPEKLLQFTLRQSGVRIYVIPTRASRVRLDGTINEENFDDGATLGDGRLRRLRFEAIKLCSKLRFPLAYKAN